MPATTTLTGNTTADVELRFTQSGKAVGNVTIAVSDRKLDKTTNEWVDGDTWFARCTIWGELAEHAAGSIPKGTRVIATGRIGQREWETKEGDKRTSVEVTLADIGPSMLHATAAVTRTTGSGGSNGRSPVGGTGGGGGSSQGSYGAQNGGDTWAPNAPAAETFGGFDDPTPF